MNQLDLLKKIAAWKTLEDVQAEEKKEEIIKWMDSVKEEKKTKKGNKFRETTDWGWRWKWETDKDGRPIIRKENDSAIMYRIDRPEWVYEEWEWKDLKQYNVWNIKFKKSWQEIHAYKKDWKLNLVKFVKKPFDLANRLYVTGHAYQQKWQSESQG